ncbi:MAG: ABC transporter substrate-binding protein, partial [Chromatiaceae bacterium]
MSFGRLRAGFRRHAPLSRLSLACLLVLAMVGCGCEAGELPIRMGLAGPPRNLDPRLATDATSERVNRLLYRRLTTFDAESLPAPELARWEALSPTHYR